MGKWGEGSHLVKVYPFLTQVGACATDGLGLRTSMGRESWGSCHPLGIRCLWSLGRSSIGRVSPWSSGHPRIYWGIKIERAAGGRDPSRWAWPEQLWSGSVSLGGCIPGKPARGFQIHRQGSLHRALAVSLSCDSVASMSGQGLMIPLAPT